MTNAKKDQCSDIKFCVHAGMSRDDTVRRIRQVYGNNSLSVWSIQRWYAAFQNGCNELNNLPWPGQPVRQTPAKIQHVQTIVQQDRRQTVRQVAGHANLSVGATFKVLKKDLSLKKKCVHWIPHQLPDAQKQRRVDRSRASLRMLGHGGQVDHVICGDESWFYAWDPMSCRDNRAWLQTNVPTPAFPVREQSVPKVMLVVFFDWYGLVFRRFVPQGQGINGALYLQILQDLHDAVHRRRPQVWRARRWGLLDDGAPAHRSFVVQQWLTQVRLPQLPHPAYSPDLNPPDFWLFAKMKKEVCGELFADVQQLENTLDREMGQIPMHDWAAAMDRYVPHLPKCIQAQGDYFEHP